MMVPVNIQIDQREARANMREGASWQRAVLQAGEKLTAENITTKRPAHGISPVHWDELLGRSAIVNIEEDQFISWDFFRAIAISRDMEKDYYVMLTGGKNNAGDFLIKISRQGIYCDHSPRS